MAVTDTNGAGPNDRLKAMAPAAGAVGIIGAIVGLSVMTAPAPRTAAPADPPASASPPPVSPDQIPGLVQPQQGQAGAGAVQTGVEIVVKFKNDGAVKDIIDAFWRDQASAKSRFDAWKASRPDFAGLKLDRVTYSNELVLVHDGSVPAAQRSTAMRTIAAKLGANSEVSYAEPNMTAHPGGQ
jgi:hypothetical protein